MAKNSKKGICVFFLVQRQIEEFLLKKKQVHKIFSFCFVLARHFCSPDVSFQMGRINQESCGRVSLAKWVKWRKGLVISIQTFEVQAGAESLTKLECGFQIWNSPP